MTRRTGWPCGGPASRWPYVGAGSSPGWPLLLPSIARLTALLSLPSRQSIAIALALSHPDAAARAKWAASAAEMAREALVSIGAEHAADGDAVDIDPPHDHVDSAVGACLLVAGALKVLGDEAGKRGWVGAALELDRRAVGGGLALLLHRFRFRFGLYGLDPGASSLVRARARSRGRGADRPPHCPLRSLASRLPVRPASDSPSGPPSPARAPALLDPQAPLLFLLRSG